MQKDFEVWHELKSKLDSIKTGVLFNEGEIWWCAVGKNMGVEVNGKSQIFARPIIIFKKLNQSSFYGIPMTTSDKTGSWYIPFMHQGKENKVMLNQIRAYDYRRLYNKLGTLDDNDWNRLKQAFHEFFA